jgi:hypothetical protein
MSQPSSAAAFRVPLDWWGVIAAFAAVGLVVSGLLPPVTW